MVCEAAKYRHKGSLTNGVYPLFFVFSAGLLRTAKPTLIVTFMEIRLKTLNVLSGKVKMRLINRPSSEDSVCTFVTHVYVNDSIPVGIHKSPARSCRDFVHFSKGTYKWKIDVKGLEVKTGTFDIYVGLQEYRELLKVHHEGKLSDAM